MAEAYKTQQDATVGLTTAFNPQNEAQKRAIAEAVSLIPPASGVITPNDLQTKNPLPIVNPNQFPDYPVSKIEPVPPLTPTPQEEKASSITSRLGGLYDSLVGKSAYKGEQEQKFGIPELTKTYNDLTSQLTALKNEAAAIPLQLQQESQGRGRTQGVLGRMERERLRTNAIAALGTSSLLAASQGAISTAQGYVDRALEQKYGPIQEQIDAAKANLDLILKDPLTSLQDKNRAEAQLQKQNDREALIAKQKENDSAIWELALKAASNGSNFKPSGQYTSLAATLQAISNAPTKEAALQIALQTGLTESSTKSNIASIQEYEYAKSQGYTGSFTDYQNEDANRKRSIAAASNGSGLTPSQINSTVNSIAGGFDNEPIVKAYNTVQEGFQTIQNIGVNTKSPADDIAFIYAFAKIMDPNSVVREGEYNTIQKYAQTWADNFGFSAKRVFSNTNFLTPDAKQKMLNALQPKVNTITNQYNQTKSEYQRQIDDAYSGKPRKITDYSTNASNSNMSVNPSKPTELSQPAQGTVKKLLNWLWGY